jgi:hypothetical protein
MLAYIDDESDRDGRQWREGGGGEDDTVEREFLETIGNKGDKLSEALSGDEIIKNAKKFQLMAFGKFWQHRAHHCHLGFGGIDCTIWL